MNMKRVLALLLTMGLLLCGCSKQKENRIDGSVLAAWEGKFAVEQRESAIAEYQKRFIPVYAVNVEGTEVVFELDFEGVACGSVLLTPVDDSTKGAELSTVIDFTGEAAVDGTTVTVDIGWWQNAQDNVRNYKLWSYLFWVTDAQDVRHYYYFRVDYTA